MVIYVYAYFSIILSRKVAEESQPADILREPDLILIAVLVRNKAYILPWFLGHLEELEYPKKKIIIW